MADLWANRAIFRAFAEGGQGYQSVQKENQSLVKRDLGSMLSGLFARVRVGPEPDDEPEKAAKRPSQPKSSSGHKRQSLGSEVRSNATSACESGY